MGVSDYSKRETGHRSEFDLLEQLHKNINDISYNSTKIRFLWNFLLHLFACFVIVKSAEMRIYFFE